jgi:hypothetical protein
VTLSYGTFTDHRGRWRRDAVAAALRRQVAAHCAEAEALRGKLSTCTDRTAELVRWLDLAVDAAFLLEHPKRLGAPAGALAIASQVWMDFRAKHDYFPERSGRPAVLSPFAHRAEVSGHLDLLMLSRRFTHTGQRVDLVAGGVRLPVVLEQVEGSLRWASSQPEVVRLQFQAEADHFEQAHHFLTAALAQRCAYVLEAA